jgi:hypothetical protein
MDDTFYSKWLSGEMGNHLPQINKSARINRNRGPWVRRRGIGNGPRDMPFNCAHQILTCVSPILLRIPCPIFLHPVSTSTHLFQSLFFLNFAACRAVKVKIIFVLSQIQWFQLANLFISH